MVEAMANSVEDYLIEGLSFKLSPGASYVQDRKQSTFNAIGTQSYVAGTGSRLIRINLADGNGWLDPSSVRIVFTLTNTDGTNILRTLGGPWSFFRRARCLFQGAITDDIDNYNRTHEMLHILTTKSNRDNDDVEGFGFRWDDDTHYGYFGNPGDRDLYNTLAVERSKTVSFKPLLGLFNQPKYLPLMWGGLVMEFEIVTNSADCVATFDASSTLWQISDVKAVCDIVHLDSALQNSYAEHVLGGKALPINYSTYISLLQGVAGPNISVNIARAVTRLNTVFVTLDNNTRGVGQGYNPGQQKVARDFNSFYHPMQGVYDFDEEVEYQLQIGGKMIPEYPVRSLSQAFYELKKALGIHGSAYHSISPSLKMYCDNHFIIGVNCEKILEAGFTGINTKAGQLLTIKIKGANGTFVTPPDKLYVTLHADNVLEIRDTGCTVFD